MRLWSLHPSYLDPIGLVALWRESLLAKKVLEGDTFGYKNHPQLLRFKNCPQPLLAINAYLRTIWEEAGTRNYSFNESKMDFIHKPIRLEITSGQLRAEFDWLCLKLQKRAPQKHEEIALIKKVKPNPIFDVIPGLKALWEKAEF